MQLRSTLKGGAHRPRPLARLDRDGLLLGYERVGDRLLLFLGRYRNALAPAQFVLERMRGDAEEPAAQGKQRPELSPCPVKVQESDLEEIVRCRRVAQRAQEEAVQARRPAAKKCCE